MTRWMVLLMVCLTAAAYWLGPRYLATNAPTEVFTVPPGCRFSIGDCEMKLPGDVSVAIQVEGSVRPLDTFQVVVRSEQLLSVMVSFEMLDMDMGINRYRLTRTHSGSWTTPVMLPICTTGRTDWVAHFDVSLKDGRAYRLEYPFSASGNPAPS